MKDCIFCKIVRGEIPCYKIYEDEKHLAFLDISQITDGHTMLIPKKHYRWVWEIEEMGEFFEVAQKIGKQMQRVSGSEMVMSAIWGEAVPHAHFHFVPQTEGNLEMVAEAWNEALSVRKKSPEQMAKIAKRFRVGL
jgi:histidine triad (HIT) family protein